MIRGQTIAGTLPPDVAVGRQCVGSHIPRRHILLQTNKKLVSVKQDLQTLYGPSRR